MILEGPLAPKLNAEAFVASEKVGDGGPGVVGLRGKPKDRVRRDERGWLGDIVGWVEDKVKYAKYGYDSTICFRVTTLPFPSHSPSTSSTSNPFNYSCLPRACSSCLVTCVDRIIWPSSSSPSEASVSI